MSNQQQQGPGQNAEAERLAAEKKAAAVKAEQERLATEKAEQEAKSKGVTLARGYGKNEESVTAYKPATITKLKSQGFKVVEVEK